MCKYYKFLGNNSGRLQYRYERDLQPIFDGWDDVRPTADCLHCNGTGLAPSGDGRTPCGFCE